MISTDEKLDRASLLYQFALINLFSTSANRRDKLFLYLLGNKYISRRQLHMLLRYPLSDKKNMCEHIGKSTRAGYLKKHSADGKDILNDVFKLTSSGLTVAEGIYASAVSEILNDSSNTFSAYALRLLSDNRENIAEYAHLIAEDSAGGFVTSTSRHTLAAKDTYIALLTSMRPSFYLAKTEVAFNDYEPNMTADHSKHGSSDVRSDSVYVIPTDRAASTLPSHGTVVCVEQDMMYQKTDVLAGKLSRYVDSVALPYYKATGIPMILCFSILSKYSAGTVVASRRDFAYIDGIVCLASMYGTYSGVASVTIGTLLKELQRLAKNTKSEDFAKYISSLASLVSEFGTECPVSDLKRRCKQNSSEDFTKDIQKALDKAHASYARHRATIFEMATNEPGIVKMAFMGFSLCTCNNLSPESLLTFFPEHTYSQVDLSPFCNFLLDEKPEYLSLYHYSCADGTEIVFRNAYRCNGTVFLLDNIVEDYCAQLRLQALVKNNARDICYVSVIPRAELPHALTLLQAILPSDMRNLVYLSMYYTTDTGELIYSAPTSLSVF